MSKRVEVVVETVGDCPYRWMDGNWAQCGNKDSMWRCKDDPRVEPPDHCPLPDVVPMSEQGHD